MDTPPPTPHPSSEKSRLDDAAAFKQVWALHRVIRRELGGAIGDQTGQRYRTALLAWAFVQGLPYRRVEPQRHIQVVHMTEGAAVAVRGTEVAMHGVTLFEHHRPDETRLYDLLVKYIPGITLDALSLWLSEPHRADPLALAAKVRRYQEREAAKREAARVARAKRLAASQTELPFALRPGTTLKFTVESPDPG